jgi:3'5'-cyclic nucleotide phosphodiesterase
LRNNRWDRAFSANNNSDDVNHAVNATISKQDDINRKVTIIIEHLIQASDVAHTMQHWHVYRKWNECFFRECCHAYDTGRSDKDPATYWYQGELGFFDFYIIPLAKKLKDCGVFDVSSDEYLDYAMHNRLEWENKGKEIVAEMVERWKTLES